MPSRLVAIALIGGSLALALMVMATRMMSTDLERVTKTLEAAASARESGAR